MNNLSPQEKLCFSHQRFCAPEAGDIDCYACLLVIQEDTLNYFKVAGSNRTKLE